MNDQNDLSALDPAKNGTLETLKRIDANTEKLAERMMREADANVRTLRRVRATQGRGRGPAPLPGATVIAPPATTNSGAQADAKASVGRAKSDKRKAQASKQDAEKLADTKPARAASLKRTPSKTESAVQQSGDAQTPQDAGQVVKAESPAQTQKRAAKVADTPAQRDSTGRFTKGESKAENALQDRKEQERQRTLAEALREGAADAVESIGGTHDAQDAIGNAAGGPIYGAAKELASAAQDLMDENNLSGRLIRKGIEKVRGKKDANPKEEEISERSADASEATGRSVDSLRDQNDDIVELMEQQASDDKKQHREVLKALDRVSKSAAAAGGGLPDVLSLGGGKGGKGGAGKIGTGKPGAGKPGIGERIKGAAGKIKGAAGRLFGLGGSAGTASTVADVATDAVGGAAKAGIGSKVLGVGAKALGWAAAPLTAAFAYGGKKEELQDRQDLTDSQKTAQATSTAIGAGGGALSGAAAGATIGAAAGSVIPGLGTAIGGIVGGIVGGIAGAWGGEKLGEAVGEQVSDTMETVEEEAARMLDERESLLEKEAEGAKWYNPASWFGGSSADAKVAGTSAGAAQSIAPSAGRQNSATGAAAGAAAGAGAGATGAGGSIVAGKGLGRVSEKYESGGRGVSTISTGVGDKGGVSYGKHQLASKTGTMAAFLKSKEGQKYGESFAGLTPGSAEFNDAYRQVVAQDSQGFADAQHAFIKRTHFDPVANYAQKKGIDPNDPAIQEALWSQSVQHSGKGNRKIIDDAVSRAGPGASREQMINAIYDARTDYASQFASRAATVDRYNRERKDVLAITATERPQPVQAVQASTAPAAPAPATVAQASTAPAAPAPATVAQASTAPAAPAPATVAQASTAPAAPAPATVAQASTAPAAPAPATVAQASTAPAAPAPATVAQALVGGRNGAQSVVSGLVEGVKQNLSSGTLLDAALPAVKAVADSGGVPAMADGLGKVAEMFAPGAGDMLKKASTMDAAGMMQSPMVSPILQSAAPVVSSLIGGGGIAGAMSNAMPLMKTVGAEAITPMHSPEPLRPPAAQAAPAPSFDPARIGAEIAKAVSTAVNTDTERKESLKSEKISGSQDTSNNVPMDFEDTLMVLISHDRI